MENIDKFAYEIIKEINIARTKPRKYAKFLKKIIKNFDENDLNYSEEQINITTVEGIDAYEEAIEYLYNVYPKPKLNLHLSLLNIAKDYLNHAKKISYEKIFRLEINDLIEKYGTFTGNFSKLMDFGGLTAKSIVINLIVCDGNQSRDYRNLIFDENFRYIGVASEPHSEYKQFTVLMISENFKSLDSKNDIPNQISEKENEEEEDEEEEEEESENEEQEEKIKKLIKFNKNDSDDLKLIKKSYKKIENKIYDLQKTNSDLNSKLNKIDQLVISEKEQFISLLRSAFENLLNEINLTPKNKEIVVYILKLLKYSEEDIINILNIIGKKKGSIFGFLK